MQGSSSLRCSGRIWALQTAILVSYRQRRDNQAGQLPCASINFFPFILGGTLNCLRFCALALAFLCSTLVMAQTGVAAPKSAQNSTPSAASDANAQIPPSSTKSGAAQPVDAPSLLPESTPVITIQGICEVSLNGTAKAPARATATKTGAASAHSAAASSGDECKTEITRAQFEKLMKLASPGAPRRQLAASLVQLLNAANEGVKLGVEKDPDFAEKLAISKLQLLGIEAKRELQTRASNVSDAELKTYYDQNASAFEEVTLTRLFVPRTPADPKQTEQPADPKAIADNARQQLMIGTDPDKIEKGIYDQLKSTNPPPSSKFGAHRRGTLPATQEQKVFDLKDGEISEVISDPSGYVVYRVDQRRQLPFEQVKDDVKQRIVRQKLTDLSQQITSASKAEYNDAYFGPETASPRMGNPGGVPPGSRPPGAASNVRPATGPSGQPAAAPSPK